MPYNQFWVDNTWDDDPEAQIFAAPGGPRDPNQPDPVLGPSMPPGGPLSPTSGAMLPPTDGGEPEGEFIWPGYQGPRSPNYSRLPGVPRFRAPQFDWSSAGLYVDPGFQFRMKEGTDALERSAAARGVLNTGGTLKDILGWGQNFASQEYGNAFDCAARVFDTRYTGAKDEYSPLFSEWQARFNAEKSRADKEWQTYWDDYVLGEQIHAQIGAE